MGCTKSLMSKIESQNIVNDFMGGAVATRTNCAHVHPPKRLQD